MQQISAIVEHASLDGVKTVLARGGASSIAISEVQNYDGHEVSTQVYRGARYYKHFTDRVRLEVLVDDAAADKVVDRIISAQKTGLIGAGRVWITQVDAMLNLGGRQSFGPVALPA